MCCGLDGGALQAGFAREQFLPPTAQYGHSHSCHLFRELSNIAPLPLLSPHKSSASWKMVARDRRKCTPAQNVRILWSFHFCSRQHHDVQEVILGDNSCSKALKTLRKQQLPHHLRGHWKFIFPINSVFLFNTHWETIPWLTTINAKNGPATALNEAVVLQQVQAFGQAKSNATDRLQLLAARFETTYPPNVRL